MVVYFLIFFRRVLAKFPPTCKAIKTVELTMETKLRNMLIKYTQPTTYTEFPQFVLFDPGSCFDKHFGK